MTRTERSARRELRTLISCAMSKERGLSDEAVRRVVNRILRQSDRLAELGGALKTARCEVSEAKPAPVAAPLPPAPAQAFDPYEIGAVVTLHRLGAPGLMDRLSGIASVDHLVSLARAQNLALKSGWSTADELRAAIVACAEQRLAERRAAAAVR
ncbi:MAG: hypothetical protein AB7S70_15240 [Hyphomicrobium sp.]|uniref:hypothetical protein n=1 Tax=Hyphomicrobium sp. TaxID=82 RepID=UPI003D14116B